MLLIYNLLKGGDDMLNINLVIFKVLGGFTNQ